MPINPAVPVTLSGFLRCYSPVLGGGRVTVEARAGDVVEYKRSGSRGTMRCQVVGFSKHQVIYQPLDYFEKIPTPVGRAFRAGHAVERVWRGGVCLGLPAPFTGKVLSFVKSGNDLEVTISRPGHEPIFLNSAAAGFPKREVKEGDLVFVVARQNLGESSAQWYVE